MCTSATEARSIRSLWSWSYSHPMWVLRTKVWVSCKSSRLLTTDNLSSHHHPDPCYPLIRKIFKDKQKRGGGDDNQYIKPPKILHWSLNQLLFINKKSWVRLSGKDPERSEKQGRSPQWPPISSVPSSKRRSDPLSACLWLQASICQNTIKISYNTPSSYTQSFPSQNIRSLELYNIKSKDVNLTFVLFVSLGFLFDFVFAGWPWPHLKETSFLTLCEEH